VTASPTADAGGKKRAGRWRGLAVLLLAAVLASCAPHLRPPTGVDEAVSPLDDLRRDLQAIVNDAATAHAVWGVEVRSLRTGATLFQWNASTLLIPASNQKLVTSAVAAARLGWDYRFETRIVAMGPVDGGTLRGDLLVVGGGDPTVNSWHPDRLFAFDDWARQLRRAGVRYVEGNLVGDDRAFADPGWGAGWEWDDLARSYAAPVGALQFNEGFVEIAAGPGMTPGAPAIVTVAPAGSGLLVANQAVTGAPGSTAVVDLQRLPGTPFVDLRGSIPYRGAPVSVTASVANPTMAYLGALESALARNDIFIRGRLVDVDDLAHRPDPSSGTTLVVDLSPRLSEIVGVVLKWSRNLPAETLLRAMDLSGSPATPRAALKRLEETLDRWGIERGTYIARDGSGLSRYNLVTASMLTSLLTYVWRDPGLASPFVEALPEAGRSGTLAGRLKDTPAEGRVRAKTGTMTHVRTLAGYVRSLEDEPMAVAILVNNHRLAPAEVDRLTDRILLRLVAFRR
jgi:D-alanyl-D-alanine carboxypeptidase/D-alanyl-D-alanine-endopeptidase (penicillin-binding protein 4)